VSEDQKQDMESDAVRKANYIKETQTAGGRGQEVGDDRITKKKGARKSQIEKGGEKEIMRIRLLTDIQEGGILRTGLPRKKRRREIALRSGSAKRIVRRELKIHPGGRS